VDNLQERTGLNIPIHVDAASGGFFAPFAYPNLKWSFDIPRVVSINTSGHKFGLVYVGIGWILWRDESFLHKDLIFELRASSSWYPDTLTVLTCLSDYLGSVEYSFTLYVPILLSFHLTSTDHLSSNFSKPAAPIIGQMFNFLNLGYEGFRRIAFKDLRNARLLSRALEGTFFKVNYSSSYACGCLTVGSGLEQYS
jgi:glutamate decarboxylase